MGQHRAAGRPIRGLRHRVSGIVGLVMVCTALGLSLPVSALAQSTPGQLRLGHLSPTTPAVDIYLGGPGSMDLLVGDAGYGAVTDYQVLEPGRYEVELRPAGDPPDTAAALATAVDVAPGSVQSLLFLDTGAAGAVQGRLLADDLTVGPGGSGKVRIVQASELGPVDAQATGGPRLATDLAYGSTTDYATVAARSWDVAVAAGGQTVQATLDVTSGSVSTVVLTTDPQGGLAVTPLTDVAGGPRPLLPSLPELSGPPVAAPGEPVAPGPGEPGPGAATAVPVPQGGVPAGGGATAGGPDPVPVLLGVVGAVLLVFGITSGPVARARCR